MKNYSWIIIAVLSLLISCSGEQASQSTDVSVPVTVTEVKLKPIFNTVAVNGSLSPAGSTELATEAEGRYSLEINPRTREPFKLGDKIFKGEKLISLQNEEYILSIRIESRKLDLDNARQEYEKQQSLYEKGGVTQRELQNSELSFINARYDYENAQLQISKLEIDAPFDGVIVELPYFTPNVRVPSSTKVAAIMDYAKLFLQADFPEKLITTIEPGQEAFVTNYNLKGDTLKATITQLSPAINASTRTFKGTVQVENNELKMRPGMFAKAEIIVDRRDSAIVVERGIIQNRRRGKIVFVVERNTAVEKSVNTGIETDTHVEIISGLEPGEQLVTEGYEMLSNRTKVRIRR
jgi:RND family efflux transporter MFP subunit